MQTMPHPVKTDIIGLFKAQVAEILTTVCPLTTEQLLPLIEHREGEAYDFSFNMQRMTHYNPAKCPLSDLANKWKSEIKLNDLITSVDIVSFTVNNASSKKKAKKAKILIYLVFCCNKAQLIKLTLDCIFDQKHQYGENNDFCGKTILVEFSSPNIAKPFHAGHLRSTIIGNFICNLYRCMGANTTSMNYLGDWGTQYGILAMGFKHFGSEEQLKEQPIQHLFHVYVEANKLIENEPDFAAVARDYFKAMEEGDEEVLSLWRRFRELSILEYAKIYKRLNIQFDVYSGESLMSQAMLKSLARLKEKAILKKDAKGRLYVPLKEYRLNDAVVVKSDDTTLYITRDIAAAEGRYEEYHFDKSIYVVNCQQDLHFQQLFKTLELMGYPWASQCLHVSFGSVLGMSTRRGDVIFLEDILDEARDVMLERIKQDKMGKLCEIEDPVETADILGLSAVVVQDLSARRIRDYPFDWNRMTSSEGATGPYLQYTHARLCSMEHKNAHIELTNQVEANLLTEKDAYRLAIQLARYPSILQSCINHHEPSTLVNYLFELGHAISTAHSMLPVLGSPDELAKARKLLFWSARMTLNNGLRIIGLTPLTRM